MTIYNHNFAKPAVDGTPLYGPMPLGVEIPHHDEWDEPVLDPETGEPTGETKHMERDWVEKYTVVHPEAEDFKLMGYLLLDNEYPVDPPQGKHYKRQATIEPDGANGYRWQYALIDNPPPVPRRWTRLAIKTALAETGMLDAAKDFLSSVEVAIGYTAWEALTDCDYIEEGFGGAEAWNALLDGAATALGKTRAEVDVFLAAIPTEGGV